MLNKNRGFFKTSPVGRTSHNNAKIPSVKFTGMPLFLLVLKRYFMDQLMSFSLVFFFFFFLAWTLSFMHLTNVAGVATFFNVTTNTNWNYYYISVKHDSIMTDGNFHFLSIPIIVRRRFKMATFLKCSLRERKFSLHVSL